MLQAALPQACVLCRASSGAALLCGDCSGGLPRLAFPCPRCALPRPAADAPCRACRLAPPPWSAATAAWPYAFPVDRLVQGLKYGGRLELAQPLADGLAHAVHAGRVDPPDVLVPLPLSRRRQHERGFNQAALIAARVGVRLDRPLLHGLVRTRDAPPQAALPLARRADNVEDAFAGLATLAGRRIALVDDVMTTGATLAAATHAALRAGAVDVQAFVVARTPPPR